jgi:2,3-diketo-5-methylthio-1-phosphopentane phosphatase
VRTFLLDIEGTTTPMSFVHDVLFPYALKRLGPFVRDAWDSVGLATIAAGLAAEHAVDVAKRERVPAWSGSSRDDAIASAVAYCEWLMDRDRKSPALKQLQGLIWDRGYDAGDLRGVVFPDVPPAFRRWQAQGRMIAIYSSGSELAQRRLFATTEYGDLTPFIVRFFDTSVGAKVEQASYTRIAAALGLPPGDICFISDLVRELRAARDAGLEVRLAVRPGNAPQDGEHAIAPVVTFENL